MSGSAPLFSCLYSTCVIQLKSFAEDEDWKYVQWFNSCWGAAEKDHSLHHFFVSNWEVLGTEWWPVRDGSWKDKEHKNWLHVEMSGGSTRTAFWVKWEHTTTHERDSLIIVRPGDSLGPPSVWQLLTLYHLVDIWAVWDVKVVAEGSRVCLFPAESQEEGFTGMIIALRALKHQPDSFKDDV